MDITKILQNFSKCQLVEIKIGLFSSNLIGSFQTTELYAHQRLDVCGLQFVVVGKSGSKISKESYIFLFLINLISSKLNDCFI